MKDKFSHNQLMSLYDLVATNYTVSIDKSGMFADEPFAFHFALFDNRYPSKIAGTGVSFESPRTAGVKALFEYIERATIFNFKKRKKYVRTVRREDLEIDIDAYLLPNALINETIECYPFQESSTGTIRYIPIELIDLSLDKASNVFLASSVGTSAGKKCEAYSKAISEVVEYDASLLWYFGALDGEKIDYGILPSSIRSIIEEFRWYGLNIEIVRVVNDFGYSTYLTFILDDTQRGPAVVCGTAADSITSNGILHSIEEAYQTRMFIRPHYTRQMLMPEYEKENYGLNQIGRLLYWSQSYMLTYIRKRLKELSPAKVYTDKLVKNREIEKDLLDKGVSIYRFNIEDRALRERDCHVMKVVMPALQPLYLEEKAQIIHKTRFTSVNSNYQFQRISNFPPHPFP